MEFSTEPNPVNPELYLIDFSKNKELFRRENLPVKQFVLGDEVTRENFASLIVKSFAVSEGIPTIQNLYLEWIRANSKFDYKLSLTSLFENGGSKCFSKTEREYLNSAFRNIKSPRHSELSKGSSSSVIEDVLTEIYAQLNLEDKPPIDKESLMGLSPRDLLVKLEEIKVDVYNKTK